jgi:hypothetical protein
VYGLSVLETIRRYWIGLLVIVLVGLHASIVGVIRYQASMAKVDASCEVDLGQYLAFQIGKKTPLQMRFHAIVPLNHRMKSRQLIELNKAQIRQSLEEYLRQIDSKVLTDPYLADLKSQLMDVLIQTIGDSSIDDLVITEVRDASDSASLEFALQGTARAPRKLVATLRNPSAVEETEEHTEATEHEHEPDHADEEEAKAPHTPAPKAHSPAKADSHAAPAKKPSGHAAPAKKPAAAKSDTGGHGAAKKPAAAAKKSGH